MEQKSLLIVWVYFPAVGHFVEAIEVAANFRAANPDFKIDILVNEDTVFTLGRFCGWIDNTYTFNVKTMIIRGQKPKSPKEFEHSYDYVVFPKRLKYTPNDFPKDLLKCNLYLQTLIRPRIWGGYNDDVYNQKEAIKELSYSEFQMTLPEEEILKAKSMTSGYPIFSIVLKGASSETIWPSLSTWRKNLLAIKKVYPQADFLITGIYKVHLKSGSSLTKEKKRINDFISSIPGAINCYDVGMEHQLALIQISDALISPHTGFAFLAPCVGTPWLALSGTRWSEPMIAHRPFYYVLPFCRNYPCNNNMKLECKLRLKMQVPVKCMADLSNRTEEILNGIQNLLDKSYTFEQSFMDYDFEATNKNVNKHKLWRLREFKKHHNIDI